MSAETLELLSLEVFFETGLDINVRKGLDLVPVFGTHGPESLSWSYLCHSAVVSHVEACLYG